MHEGEGVVDEQEQLEIGEKLTTSQGIGNLAAALAASQIEFLPVLKDTDNPFFKSKYADLSAVISATQPALAKNKLVVIQSPVVRLQDQKAGVITRLVHGSGEWMSSELLLPATMQGRDNNPRFDAQSVGSAITYARRYAYQAMVGVAAEVDDDGNAAAGNGSKAAQQQVAATKLKEHANGDETITLADWKEGRLSLSGSNGIAILKAALTNEEKELLGVVVTDKVVNIPKDHGHLFVAACQRNKVPTIWMGAPTEQKTSQPAMEKTIQSATRKEGDRKDKKTGKDVHWELLEVVWGESRYLCWDKKLFEYLEAGKGQVAELYTTPSFDLKKDPTIEGIARIGKTTFTDNVPDIQQKEVA